MITLRKKMFLFKPTLLDIPRTTNPHKDPTSFKFRKIPMSPPGLNSSLPSPSNPNPSLSPSPNSNISGHPPLVKSQTSQKTNTIKATGENSLELAKKWQGTSL